MKSRLHPDLRLLLPDALRDALGWGPDKEAENTAEGGKSKAKPSQEIRVDAVRAAIEWGQQTSTRGIAKVLVVHPAQAMNATAANALLKTLEEPPGLLRLVLVASDPDALLATVRSRCQRVRLTVPPRDQALAWLRAQGIAGAEVLLDAAGGCPLDVPPLIRCGIDDRLWAQLPGRVRQGDATACANWPLPTVVETLQKLCLDLMRLCVGAAPTYFPAAALPLGAHMPELARWSRALADAARHDGHPWHAGLFVEALVLQARDVWPPAGSTAGARTDSGLATLQSR